MALAPASVEELAFASPPLLAVALEPAPLCAVAFAVPRSPVSSALAPAPPVALAIAIPLVPPAVVVALAPAPVLALERAVPPWASELAAPPDTAFEMETPVASEVEDASLEFPRALAKALPPAEVAVHELPSAPDKVVEPTPFSRQTVAALA